MSETNKRLVPEGGFDGDAANKVTKALFAESLVVAGESSRPEKAAEPDGDNGGDAQEDSEPSIFASSSIFGTSIAPLPNLFGATASTLTTANFFANFGKPKNGGVAEVPPVPGQKEEEEVE
eukprot:Trichotokara_eunicae@DN9722_c0_g1_i1.p1